MASKSKIIGVEFTGNADGIITAADEAAGAMDDAAAKAEAANERVAESAKESADVQADAAEEAAAKVAAAYQEQVDAADAASAKQAEYAERAAAAQSAAAERAAKTAAAESDAASQAMADGDEAAYDRAATAAEAAAAKAASAWEKAAAAQAKAVAAAADVMDEDARAAADVMAEAATAAAAKARLAWEAAAASADKAMALTDVEADATALDTKMVDLSAGIGGAFSKLGRLLVGLPLVGGAFEKMGTSVEGAEAKVDGFGSAMISFGKIVTIAGVAGFVAVGYESVKMASKFQASMEMLHTQAGVAQSAITGLEKGVEGLAGQVGESPEELSTGLYHLASNGLRGADAMKALKIAAEGARVGNANLEDVTNALGATIASKMVPGVKDYSQAMGILNATVGSGDMRMQDLADAMGTGMLATVKGFGVSLTDVGAALAVFGDNNIRGAKAGTELRMAVQALAAPITTGGAALKALGLTTTTLADEMQKGGLKGAIDMLAAHMTKAGYTGDKVGAILTDAFGKKAGAGINVLTEQLGRFNGKFADIDESSGKFGSDWAATQQTAKQQMADLVAQVEALGDKFGIWLVPQLEKAAAAVEKLVVWFEKHKTVAEALGIVIGTVLTAAVLSFAASLAVAAAAELVALAPIIAIVAAAALLGVAIYELVTHWKTVWKDIKDIIGDAEAFVKSHLTDIEIGLIAVLGPIGLLIDGFIELGTHWRQILTGMESAAEGLWHFLDGVWDGAESDAESAWNTVMSFFESVWKDIVDIFHESLDAVKTALSDAWDWVKSTTTSVWDTIRNLLTSTWDTIRSTVTSVWDSIEHIFSTVWSTIRATFSTGITAVVSFMASLPGRAMSAVSALAGDLLAFGGRVMLDMLNGVIGGAGTLWAWLSAFPTKVVLSIGNLGGLLISAGEQMMQGFVQGISNMVGTVIDAAVGSVERAYEGVLHFLHIGSPSKLFAEVGENMMAGVAQGINGSSTLASSAAVDALSEVYSKSKAKALRLPVSFDIGSGVSVPGLSGSALSSLAAGGGGQATPVTYAPTYSPVFTGEISQQTVNAMETMFEQHDQALIRVLTRV